MCTSNIKDIRILVEPILQSFFKLNKGSSIRVVAECRNNVDLGTIVLRDLILDCIPDDCDVSVDLKNPKFTLIITVFKSVAGFSILEGYDEFKKYNIQFVCK